MIKRLVVEPTVTEHIIVPPRLRTPTREAIDRMKDSLLAVGLLTPIAVRVVPEMEIAGQITCGVPVLVFGATRLAAAKELGWREIDTQEIDLDDIEAKLAEIAENLHRTELTVQERAEHVAEWVRLTEAKGVSAQVAPKLSARNRAGEGRPEGGINAAVRDLGIDRTEAQRAVKIASIAPEAKAAAASAGLSDNQSALLDIAKQQTPEAQVSRVREIRQAKDAPKPRKVAVEVTRVEAAPQTVKITVERVEAPSRTIALNVTSGRGSPEPAPHPAEADAAERDRAARFLADILIEAAAELRPGIAAALDLTCAVTARHYAALRAARETPAAIAPAAPEPSYVPAWRVRKLRAALRDAEERGRSREDAADLAHRALLRRYSLGRAAAERPRDIAFPRRKPPLTITGVPFGVLDSEVRKMVQERHFIQVRTLPYADLAATEKGAIIDPGQPTPETMDDVRELIDASMAQLDAGTISERESGLRSRIFEKVIREHQSGLKQRIGRSKEISALPTVPAGPEAQARVRALHDAMERRDDPDLTLPDDPPPAFPKALRDLLDNRDWDRPRDLPTGRTAPRLTFRDFLCRRFPEGIGSSYDDVARRVLASGDEALLAAFERAAGGTPQRVA